MFTLAIAFAFSGPFLDMGSFTTENACKAAGERFLKATANAANEGIRSGLYKCINIEQAPLGLEGRVFPRTGPVPAIAGSYVLHAGLGADV